MTASSVTGPQPFFLGTEIKCEHGIASLIMMTVEGTKSLLVSYQHSITQHQMGVKRNYARRSLNISYGGVNRMFW